MQAFLMELSSLDEALTSLRTRVAATSLSAEDKVEMCSYIENCNTSLLTLRDTCSFMNATINRCLDYGKTTVGMALLPLQASIYLQEAMSWVVNCVNRTQEGAVSASHRSCLVLCIILSCLVWFRLDQLLLLEFYFGSLNRL